MARDPRVAALARLRSALATHRLAYKAERRARDQLDRAIGSAYTKGIGSAELGRELGITAPSVHKRLEKMGIKS